MTKQNSELQPIKIQQVGRTLIAVVDGKKLPALVEKDKEKVKDIKKLIESYNALPSSSKKEKIMRLFMPKTEAKLLKAKVEKKKIKHEIKIIQEASKQIAKDIKDEDKEKAKRILVAQSVIKDKRFVVKGADMYLDPFTTVPLPMTLIQELEYFTVSGQSLEPLIKFWQLALLNPNPIARTKLFDYLSRHKLIITEDGYFVTYRMVKKTNDPKIFTSARTGQEKYYVGQAFKMDRKECDEDGKNDCSRGLHTGTPDFIGIKLGDGYSAGTRVVKTKSQGGGYGTGYDAPEEVSTNQKFDDSFGNQAVIVLVNPMHVVSVPDSDTRKLRACELYFCKPTTAEEVIKLQTSEYSIYNAQYKQYEKEQIEAMLKETKLTNWVDDTKKSLKRKTTDQALAALNKRQEELRKIVTLTGDEPSKELSLTDINTIIQSRLK